MVLVVCVGGLVPLPDMRSQGVFVFVPDSGDWSVGDR